MKIGIVDYELNNINSVKNALDRLDCENLVIKKLKDFKLVDAIILPGVGSYGEAISKLNNSKMSEKIYNEVTIKNLFRYLFRYAVNVNKWIRRRIF